MNQLGGGVSWSKPAGLVCHICGREYGTTSLQIHLPQCAALWKARQKLLPRSERRPLPKAPLSMAEMQSMKVDASDAEAMDRFNRQQMDAYTAQSLKQCQHCGRRFLEEKSHAPPTPLPPPLPSPQPSPMLPVHQRSCTADRPAAAVGSHRLKQADAAELTSPTPSAFNAAAHPPRSLPSPPRKAVPEESKALDDGDIVVPSKDYDLSQLPSDDSSSASADMLPCSLCGRKFTSERVARHEAVCAKSRAPKALQRPQTSIAAASSAPTATSASATSDGGKWKSEHSEFQQAIQYVKKLTQMQKAGVNIASLPPPPAATNPGYVQCPHCQRRFNATAAERHIPACATTINRPKPPPQLRPTTTSSIVAATYAPTAGQAGGAALSRALAKSGIGMKPLSRQPQMSPAGGGAKVKVETTAGTAQKPSGDVASADLHSQMQQLTATVALLAQQVSSGRGAVSGFPAIPGASHHLGGAAGGGPCKACAGMLPSCARYCSHCGAPQA